MESAATELKEFPTLHVDGTNEPTAYYAALFHLQQGLAALGSLPPGRGPARRKIHQELVEMQQQVLSLLHIHFAPFDPASGKASFGERLRQHRDESGLTQEELGRLAGISASLIRKLEYGEKTPTRSSLLRLCAVPELKLVPSGISTMPAERDASTRVSPNWYVSPGFDALQMIGDLAQQLNGSGGSIEQTSVYLDHKSASDWVAIFNGSGHVSALREATPYAPVAKCLREIAGKVGLDVIALGSGDGKGEVRLVQRILDVFEEPSIRFYLVDASQPLLNSAFQHAINTFDDHMGVFVCGLQANFHHLSRYAQLHYTPARSHRRRVYTLLGGTMGNLEHEPQFFRTALAGAAPGDLLVFDLTLPFTDSTDPDEIRRADPAFNQPISPAHERWLRGPLGRYCVGLTDVKFDFELDQDRPIAGSYGIRFMADAYSSNHPVRRFCMWNVRRYSITPLVACLKNIGWDCVGNFPFGQDFGRPCGMLVFQRRLRLQ
jgi:transcriptional regulator with XRE-family HTH domain